MTTGLDEVNGRLADPFTVVAFIVYGVALTGLFLITQMVWPALLLGLGTAVSGGIVWAVTRRQTARPVTVIRPRAELWLPLTWSGIVVLLDAFTRAEGMELVNQFTNWVFLVIAPFTLLAVLRRSGRATLRSVGLARTGLKDALRVTAGFVEEFFFRGLLQSRLAFCLDSEWRGLLVASLLFGLFHLPLYLYSPFEPTQGNFAWALTSTLTEQAVVGVLLGILWARTHHLAAPILLHALINGLAWMTNLQIGG